ncbi:hypothetical protein BK128_03815 [Viridibacillus sp. FSL H7-0596]|nr:hypothetical protein BK128_03815 [Viridibacillus sp. FSL H7-0596]
MSPTSKTTDSLNICGNPCIPSKINPTITDAIIHTPQTTSLIHQNPQKYKKENGNKTNESREN